MSNDANDAGKKGDQDEAAFWVKMIEQLAGAGADKIDPNTVIMAGTAIECDFGNSKSKADYAVWNIGDCVPGWSLTWPGSKTGSFFGSYQHWINLIHPTPVDPDAAKKLPAIKKKIEQYDNGINSIMKEQYKQYMSDYCLEPNPDGSCKTWLPGQSAAGFLKYWKKYQKGATYQDQVANLVQEVGQDLSGLQSDYNTLAQKAYGPNYQQIEEAQAAVAKADPKADNSSLSDKELLQYQMPANENGVNIEVPRYAMGITKKDFNSWLEGAKSGQGSQITMELKKSDHETDYSHYQFSGGGGFPIEDIFMIGGHVSGSNTTVNINNYDFDMLVTYESILYVPIDPASSWYEGNMITDYKGFKGFPPGDSFADDLWGPKGKFNLRVTGCYVAYGQTTKFTVADWDKFTSDTKWHEDASFSLFGLINIASESSSGEKKETKITSYNNGFEMQDTSGVPKIIALTVETLNYP